MAPQIHPHGPAAQGFGDFSYGSLSGGLLSSLDFWGLRPFCAVHTLSVGVGVWGSSWRGGHLPCTAKIVATVR